MTAYLWMTLSLCSVPGILHTLVLWTNWLSFVLLGQIYIMGRSDWRGAPSVVHFLYSLHVLILKYSVCLVGYSQSLDGSSTGAWRRFCVNQNGDALGVDSKWRQYFLFIKSTQIRQTGSVVKFTRLLGGSDNAWRKGLSRLHRRGWLVGGNRWIDLKHKTGGSRADRCHSLCFFCYLSLFLLAVYILVLCPSYFGSAPSVPVTPHPHPQSASPVLQSVITHTRF